MAVGVTGGNLELRERHREEEKPEEAVSGSRVLLLASKTEMEVFPVNVETDCSDSTLALSGLYLGWPMRAHRVHWV